MALADDGGEVVEYHEIGKKEGPEPVVEMDGSTVVGEMREIDGVGLVEIEGVETRAELEGSSGR